MQSWFNFMNIRCLANFDFWANLDNSYSWSISGIYHYYSFWNCPIIRSSIHKYLFTNIEDDGNRCNIWLVMSGFINYGACMTLAYDSHNANTRSALRNRKPNPRHFYTLYMGFGPLTLWYIWSIEHGQWYIITNNKSSLGTRKRKKKNPCYLLFHPLSTAKHL